MRYKYKSIAAFRRLSALLILIAVLVTSPVLAKTDEATEVLDSESASARSQLEESDEALI